MKRFHRGLIACGTRRFALLLGFVTLASTLAAQQISLPLKPNSVRFAAIGDMGTGDNAQYEIARRMTEFRQKFSFDFVIMLGDNMYGGKQPRDFEKKFEIPYRPLLDAKVQFYAALGNHDTPGERLYKLFNMNGQSYYAYKKGNVRFFALDSNYMSPEQLAWLEKELKNSGSDWKICYFHHPLYSSGAFHGSSVELRGLLEPIFTKYGVNVVFSGHEHVYERIKPQKGIYYFTEGASGELRYGNLRPTEFKAAGFDTDRTFMLVEISGDELYFQTVSRTGQTVDSGVIRRTVEIQPAKVSAAQPAKARATRPASRRTRAQTTAQRKVQTVAGPTSR